MTYCIAGGQSFNMVLSHRDKGDPTLFGMEEDILGDMRKEFQGWDSQYVNTLPGHTHPRFLFPPPPFS